MWTDDGEGGRSGGAVCTYGGVMLRMLPAHLGAADVYSLRLSSSWNSWLFLLRGSRFTEKGLSKGCKCQG